MDQKYIKYIHNFSQSLVTKLGFKITKEIAEEQSYFIGYSSKNFIVKIDKYFREFYVTLYKVDKVDKGIELFNLLEYLNGDIGNPPKPINVLKEKDLEECYRKQLDEISRAFFDNYTAIDDFFCEDNFARNFKDMRKFRQKKYPELYKTID